MRSVERDPQSVLDYGLKSVPTLMLLSFRAGGDAHLGADLPGELLVEGSPHFLIAQSRHPVREVKCIVPQDPQSLRPHCIKGTSQRRSETGMLDGCVLFPARKYNSQQILDIVLILRILRLLRIIVSIQR